MDEIIKKKDGWFRIKMYTTASSRLETYAFKTRWSLFFHIFKWGIRGYIKTKMKKLCQK